MAKAIKTRVNNQATSVMSTRFTVLTSEALYLLTIYHIAPVMMWAKELIA